MASRVVRVSDTYLDTLRDRYGTHLSDGELVQLALAEVTTRPAAEPIALEVEEEEAKPRIPEPEPSVVSGDETALGKYFDAHWKYKTTGAIGAPMFQAWLNPPKPYGFSVWNSKKPSMRPWKFRPGLIERFKNEAKAWEGFSLVIGEAAVEPARSAAARGVPYLPGDVEVFFTVADVAKAWVTLGKRKDVPFPLKVDALRYADDPAYAGLVDTYATYYAAYYWDGRPWGTEDDEP